MFFSALTDQPDASQQRKGYGMNLEKIGDLLETIESILNTESGAGKKALAPLFDELYESVVGKYRPVIQAAPLLVGKVAGDAAPIVTAILKGVNDVVENSEFKAEIERARGIRATNRRDNYKAYTKAGFSRAEAMALVLVDAANAKAAFADFYKNVRAASSSSNGD